MLQELYDKQVKTSIRECKGAMQNPTIYTPNVIDEEMKCIKKHLNEIDAEQRIQNSEIDTLKCGNFDNIKVADTLKVDKIESFSTGTVTFVDPVNIADLTVENFHIQCFCADDTKKFAGQDCDQWKDIINNSCVSDTCKFSGLSCTEWKDEIKTTCVDNAKNATCFDNKTYGQVCEDILSSIPPQPFSGEIDVYCGATCLCTINCENPLVLSENAFNEYAKISTETYPGAYCTGTVVESDIQDFITMNDVDQCGYTTCVGTVTSIKTCLNGCESNTVTDNGTLALDITPSLCFSSSSRKICNKLGNKTSNEITLPVGINCTGTLVASDIADFITMSDVDACGYTTCKGTVTQVKVGTNEYNPSNGVISLPDYPPDLSSCPGLDCTGDVTTSQLNAVSNRVTSIEDKIPSQASSTNQLADKEFVNSSIETNTATFRGTFNSVADLEAYTGPKDNNDYAFVVTFNSATSSYQYDRYKYNGTSWVFEYTINTTGFTAEQLAALNSGITCTLVEKITNVYNCKICIQKNNTCIDSFTLNQSSNKSINIAVPTKTSDITNDCNYTSCTGTVTGVTLNNCAFTGTGALSATIKPSLCYTSTDRKLYTKLGNQTSSAVTLPSGIDCTGTLTGVSLNGTSFTIENGIASLTDFKPATAGTADNSTCFNGCTYAQACTNIRSGLCSHDCLVKLSFLCSNIDRRILFSAQEAGCICPVYASNGVSFTYNPSNGYLKIGDFSCDCCHQLTLRPQSGIIHSGPKGTQNNLGVVYLEKNCLDNCSIGVGIGSGNVNRGFFDYYKDSETATSPTFRWLQYWNAEREIHALPIWGELGADNKVVYSCVAPVPSNTKRYVLVCFDKTCTCNPSQSSAFFEIEDYSSKYFVWIDVSNSAAILRTYWQTNGIDPNGNAYGSFCAALPDTTSNGNCFWIAYGGYRAPVIKSIRKISIICNTTTAPSGITFTAPTNRNSYTNVYCGTTCLCTLQGPANLCLGSLAFSSATIPTVNNSTIKIQKNSADVGSFTLNQATGATIDISVPTKTSDITNDSNFITMAQVDACDYTTCKGTVTGVSLNGSSFIVNNGVATLTNFKPATASLADCADGVRRRLSDSTLPLLLAGGTGESCCGYTNIACTCQITYNGGTGLLTTRKLTLGLGENCTDAGVICAKGLCQTYPVICFLNNTSSTDGNGYKISGGGIGIIGAGEGSNYVWCSLNSNSTSLYGACAGKECLFLTSDNAIFFYTNTQTNNSACWKTPFIDTSGVYNGAVKGNVTGNLTGTASLVCRYTINTGVQQVLLGASCCASSGTCVRVSSKCLLTFDPGTGILSTNKVNAMNTDNWSSVYSGNTYSSGYYLLAQLTGSAATGNHDVTLYGTTFRNSAEIDYPTTFRVYVRGNCLTVNSTSFRVDNTYNDIYATYEVTTGCKFIIRLYGCVPKYYTRYNTQITYASSGDVSTRISTHNSCITFPNTHFDAIPTTETLITKNPLTMMNATCFAGVTYAQACADIRTGLVSSISLNGNAFTVNNGAATLTGFKPATASLADCSTYVKRNVLANTTDAYYPLVLSNASTASNKASLYTPQAGSVSYNAKQSTLKTYCFETQYVKSDNLDVGFAGQSTSVFINSCYCALDNTKVVREWIFCGKDGYLWGNVCGNICGDAQNAKAISRHIADANTTYDLLLTNGRSTADCTNVYVSSGGSNCTLKYDTGTHILSVTNISACCVCTPNLVTDNLTVCCGLNFTKPICTTGACIFTSAYNCCQNKPIWPTIETDSSIKGKRWEYVANNGQCCTCVCRIAGVFGIQPMIIHSKAKQCDVFAAIQDTGIIDVTTGSYGILGNAWTYCVSASCHYYIDNIYFGTDDDYYISFRTVNAERLRVYAECTDEVDWNVDFISFNRYADIWF